MNIANIEQLMFVGMDYQSYFLLKEGFKPVIRVATSKELIEEFKKICKNLGLSVLVKEFSEIYGTKLEKASFNAYISNSKESAEEAYEVERGGDRKTFGKLLGYPACCVDKFIENLKSPVDYTIQTFLNTKTNPSFYCNFIFNFDSKLDDGGIKIYQENYRIFNKTKLYFLIRHMSCSFDCKKSIEIGKKTLEILNREMPQLAESIVHALKRPVLYLDYFNWLVFNGEINGNELVYKEVLLYDSLFPKEKLELIKRGNVVKVFDEKIQVLKDENILLEIPKKDRYKGVLIDFI